MWWVTLSLGDCYLTKDKIREISEKPEQLPQYIEQIRSLNTGKVTVVLAATRASSIPSA